MEGRMEGCMESCITFVRNLLLEGFPLEKAMQLASVPEELWEKVLAAVQQ